MYRTDDPEADFTRWDAGVARREAMWPTCTRCGYPILDDELFDFWGKTYHVDCAEEAFKKDSDDYIIDYIEGAHIYDGNI